MPKSTDPSQIAVSATQTDNTTPILNSQIKRQRDAYEASQISDYPDPHDKYFSEDVSGKLNELSGALPDKPPALGEGYKQFPGGSITGVVDWGILKQADSDVWARGDFWDLNPDFSGVASNVMSSTNKIEGSEAFPYKRDFAPTSLNGEDPRDADYNVENLTLHGSGSGASHLCGFLDSNGGLQAGRVISDKDFFGITSYSGVTISGTLCPADRGVVALIRTDDQDDLSAGTNDLATMQRRVVAAINLGQGVNSGVDGFPSTEGIFTEGSDTFPSRSTGQYDLLELTTAQYSILDPSRPLGAIPNITADPALGSVRLLREVIPGFWGGIHEGGHIPVLFSHRVYNYDSAQWEEGNDEKARNFLAYRMPLQISYDSDRIDGIPNIERSRFFRPKRLSVYGDGDLYDTAGGYIGFNNDSPEVQIARFRYSIKWENIEAGLLARIDQARTGAVPYVNIGSFTLVHFKTERDFERLIRYGELPSRENLYSVSSAQTNWQDLSSALNMTSSEEFDSKGQLADTVQDSPVNLSVRPNVLITGIENSKYGTIDQLTIEEFRHYDDYDAANNQSVFSNKIGSTHRYTYVSGIPYLLPRTQRVYDDVKGTVAEPLYTSPLHGGVVTGGNRESAGFAFTTVHEEIATEKIAGEALNFGSPFYVSFDADRTPLTIDPYQVKTPATFKYHFEHLSGHNNLSTVALSFLDGYLRNESMNVGQLQDSLLNIDYDALVSAGAFNALATPITTNQNELGRWVSVIGSVVSTGDGGQYLTDEPDTITPIFTDDLNIGFSALSPMSHVASVPFEDFIWSGADGHPAVGTGNPQDILDGKKMLFHSARAESLIQDAQVEEIEFSLQMIEAGGLQNEDYAFSVFRLSPEGYLMAQELDLVTDALERCDGSAIVRGDLLNFYTQYADMIPIYRPNYPAGFTGDYTGVGADFKMKMVINNVQKDYTGGDGSETFDSYFFFFYSRGLASFGYDKILLKVLPNQANFTSITVSNPIVNVGGLFIEPDDGIDIDQNLDTTYLTSGGWLTNNPNGITFSDIITGTGPLAGAPQLGIEVAQRPGIETSEYGNLYDNDNLTLQVTPSFNSNGDPLFKPYDGGYTPRKRVQERFLDEMFRIFSDFSGFTDQLTLADGVTQVSAQQVLRDGNTDTKDQFSAIDFLVSDSGVSVFSGYNPIVYPSVSDFPHKASGWVRLLRNYYDITDSGDFPHAELQVKGLPYMTRLQSQSARPSLCRGLAVIPFQDYSSTHRPSVAEGDLIDLKDYSSGYDGYTDQVTDAYCYTRAFDAGFGVMNEEMTDQITIRIVGLKFEDLDRNYSTDSTPANQFPDCSSADAPPYAVLVQIPGTTRWLNVARTNDPANKNGGGNANIYTGCYLSHQDNVLKEEAVVCTDIRISFDPFSLQENTYAEKPLLVRVVVTKNNSYNAPIAPYDFTSNTFNPSDVYHVSTLERRGLIGIELLRDSNGLNYDGDEVVPFDQY